MRIGKINALNFSGLWSETQREKLGRKDGFEPPVHLRDITYHPFKDETEEEIKEAMEKAKDNRFFACYSNETINTEKTPLYYVAQTLYLGDSLEITKADYKKISKMREKNEPTSSQFISYHAQSIK